MTEQRGNRSILPDAERGAARPSELFALLADARRRYLLYRLREESRCRLSTLARDIVAHETDTLGAVPPDRIRAVYLDLHQTHLPKLDAAGVVDYSDRLGEVVLVRTDEAFTRCLDAAVGLETG